MRNITRQCVRDGGITCVNLGELRDEIGKRKLGKWVLGEIADALADEGLSYFPLGVLDPNDNLVPRQEHGVWIYLNDNSPVSTAIEAVLNPGNKDVGAILKSLVGTDYRGMTTHRRLQLIKEIAGG
ncbi:MULTISPECIES: hypothetical protein [unclassified Streptomyces]|uniref:hypothetical protein n=1 Tax=unclassified Streptomyces TaxID=2593676 RepID=UPI00081DABF2|nr:MULTISPECIES: hypothetical protein [unclassified Streptomyces]MYR28715.1 hypothetical protein [Streptomyces sp. SID4945]SCF40678.1 hypothetical protein GA0115257_11572 [Streptomyces sp. LcepLS]